VQLGIMGQKRTGLYNRPATVMAIATMIKSAAETSRIPRPFSTHLTNGRLYSSGSGENWRG